MIDWKASKSEMMREALLVVVAFVVAYLMTRPVTAADWGGFTVTFGVFIVVIAVFESFNKKKSSEEKK